MTERDEGEKRDPRARANRSEIDRIEMLEGDTQKLAQAVTSINKSLTSFSPEQLDQLRSLFREELADAGLRIDGPEHVDDAREDFRFLRRMRSAEQPQAAPIRTSERRIG